VLLDLWLDLTVPALPLASFIFAKEHIPSLYLKGAIFEVRILMPNLTFSTLNFTVINSMKARLERVVKEAVSRTQRSILRENSDSF